MQIFFLLGSKVNTPNYEWLLIPRGIVWRGGKYLKVLIKVNLRPVRHVNTTCALPGSQEWEASLLWSFLNISRLTYVFIYWYWELNLIPVPHTWSLAKETFFLFFFFLFLLYQEANSVPRACQGAYAAELYLQPCRLI